MKKSTRVILATCVAILFFTNLFSSNSNVDRRETSAVGLTNYVWYRDEELTDIVGTVSEVNVEANRLKNVYPMYIFNSTPGPGLLPYEWGVAGSLPIAIIYSNKW